MHAEEPVKTTIVLCASRTVPEIENEMEARGIRVRWAPSITAAAALLDSAPNGAVIITELALRDGNWRDLVERLRRIGKPIRVALVSPTRTSELWWDALECGVEDILLAPLSAHRICEYLDIR
ncbi:MAG TPA: response regulator [Silvibacterium sp.]|nr:response regulator [Silvibacterium sp.]